MKAMTMGGLIVLQVRVIGALVLRETRATFGTSHFGYLWAIVTPTASVAVLVVLFTAIDRQPPFGSSLALFFATGILTLEFFNKLSNTLMGTFTANKALLTYPPIKMTDALFARVILISATYVLIMTIFFTGLVVAKMAEWPAYPEQLVLAFAATTLLGFGFGTLNAVIVSLWDSWAQIEKILTRPLIFISGIFYLPSNLPPEAIAFLKWNPVLHLVEWMRTGYYPNYYSTILDITYLLWVMMFLILFGLAGERVFRKQRV